MNAIILFYKYIHIQYPVQILKWQKALCSKLGLKGRIIIAHEGINGTLGGLHENLMEYQNAMESHTLFDGIDFKITTNTQDHFPRIRIVVKNEIVNLGLDPSIAPAKEAGIHLEPTQAHELIAQKPDDLVIIDCRNPYESAIGTIPGALRPDGAHFRDFPAYIDNNLEQFANKQVLMYCTGGVRCERASAYIKSKGITKKVYHIKGGIHRYIEQFPDGFFRGKNYVFDGRTAVKVTDDILGRCFLCQTSCDDYTNCLRAACNRHHIACTPCIQKYGNTCSTICYDMITQQHVQKRPNPTKVYNAT
jgi:predicted sulfurtransferase